MKKYQKVEKIEIESEEEHKRIAGALRRIGKLSVNGLNEQERQAVLKKSE